MLLAVIASALLTASPASAAPARVDLQGTLEEVHAHTRSKGTSGWMLSTRAGRRVPLLLARDRVPRSGSQVRVQGIRWRSSVLVQKLKKLPGGVVARASVAPRGELKTAVVMFNFTDDRSRPFSAEQVREALFTGQRSANAFLSEESHGAVSLAGRDQPDGDVLGWYEIDASETACMGTNWDWLDKANAAVAAAGKSLEGYDHVIYLHPATTACAWSGIGALGGDWSVFNGEIALWLTGHELGHNYGFEHAGKAYCVDAENRPVAVSSNCSVGEYDDPYDIMGNRQQRRSSVIRQLQAGWLPQANVTTVTQSGAYTLAALEHRLDATQGLRIPRGDGRSYWLEFRRPAGVFDDFAPGDAAVNGVTIRLADDGPAAVTELIDTNPAGPKGAHDEPLAVGRTFTDAKHGIQVTTHAAAEAGATVTVTLGPVAAVEEAAVTPAAAPVPVAPAPAPAPAPEPAPAPVTTPAPSPAAPKTTSMLGNEFISTAEAESRSPNSVLLQAMSARRGSVRVAVGLLRTVDGRALALGRGRVPRLDLRFRPTARLLSRGGSLRLHARSRRGCRAEVLTRTTGGWRRIARVDVGRRFREATVALPAGALRRVLDVRVGCRRAPQALDIDAASLISA